MADIVPFRGIRYDLARVPDPAAVLAPPYDVVSEAERAELEARHPRNVVRLILPRGEGHERYGRAAADWRAWLADGTLARDARPAIYRYHQSFTAEGGEHTRKGFVALLRLSRFGEGEVLPHERTLSGPKADRLELMRACRAHFSQIFTLYPDPGRETDEPFAALEAGAPDLDARTPDGTRQRIWRLVDPEAQLRLRRAMAARKLYIADGHHRYETMCVLRDELAAAHPEAGPRSALRFGLVFFANMDDPGLVVLPTHRLVHGLADFRVEELLAAARDAFTIDARPGRDPATVRRVLAERGAHAPAFALVVPERDAVYYLALRPEAAARIPGPEVVRSLDVTVLHALVLERLLGIDREKLEKQTNLRYVKSLAEAFAAVQRREAQAAFLMNATRVHQVRDVADAGEVMPQKSTFFVPKLASGVVMNAIDPAEELQAPV